MRSLKPLPGTFTSISVPSWHPWDRKLLDGVPSGTVSSPLAATALVASLQTHHSLLSVPGPQWG